MRTSIWLTTSCSFLVALAACVAASEPSPSASSDLASCTKKDGAPPDSAAADAATCVAPVSEGAACSVVGEQALGDIPLYATSPEYKIYVNCTCNGTAWHCPTVQESKIGPCGEDTSFGPGD